MFKTPMAWSNLRARLADTLLGSLPAVVIFLMIPFAIYLPNQQDFDHNLMTVMPFVGIAAGWFLLVALLVFAAPRLAGKIVVPLFYLGIFLGLSDIVAPVQLGLITGEERIEIPEPLFLIVIELLLAVALAVCFLKLPAKFARRIGPLPIVVLLVSEIFVVAYGLDPETNFGKRPPNEPKPPAAVHTRGGNVYHFLLDAYSAAEFPKSLTRLGSAGEFDGFVFFPNARANYLSTTMSVASLMTSTFYRGGSLEEWWEGWKEGGITRAAHDAGYAIYSYQSYPNFGPIIASNVDILEEFEAKAKKLNFANLWLLRSVPGFLQQEVYAEGKGVFGQIMGARFSSWQSERAFASVDFMRQITRDEPNRPDHGQYVFAHIMLPHGPYVVDENCEYRENSNNSAQSICVTRLMGEFISTLKELGRYHQSTILFQADHGVWWTKTPEDSDLFFNIKEGGEALDVWDKNYMVDSMKTLVTRTHSLVLFKPPLKSGTPLDISDRRVQLIDIAPTLAELMGWSLVPAEGRSIFSNNFPEDPELNFFLGYFLRIEGVVQTAHSKSPVGEYDHVTYDKKRGWKLQSPIKYRRR